MYHHLRLLAARFELILVSLSDQEVSREQIQELEKFCSRVVVHRLRWPGLLWSLLTGLFSRKPLQVHYFFRKKIARLIRELVRQTRPDVVYCQLLRMAEYAKGLEAPVVLDYMDAFSLGMERRAEQSAWWKRPIFWLEQRRLVAYEQAIFPWFRGHAMISEQDIGALQLPEDWEEAIRMIPNGVDAGFFQPKEEVEPDMELLFVGNMGYFPNVRAASILARQILPVIREDQPASLMLAGARPAPEVQLLATENGVLLTGWVEDIRDCYARGQVFAAPLFAGSGQQNKILEAMAMGIPCVVTSIVNEAIGATPGQHLLVADSVEAFIPAIRRLLNNPDLRAEMGREARDFVLKHYAWEAVGHEVEAWLTAAMEGE